MKAVRREESIRLKYKVLDSHTPAARSPQATVLRIDFFEHHQGAAIGACRRRTPHPGCASRSR